MTDEEEAFEALGGIIYEIAGGIDTASLCPDCKKKLYETRLTRILRQIATLLGYETTG